MILGITNADLEEFERSMIKVYPTPENKIYPFEQRKLEAVKELLRKHPLPDRITGGKPLKLD